ncbi:MAG: type I restriction-modification system subunit M [Bacteroidetes bacterium]|nr:type I restriction-modification system subunit M [Bacteroidota bacterium]
MNKQQLAAKIWESANQMRSKIEANEYKDYILGFIFYKYLSEQEIKFAKREDFTENDLISLSDDDAEYFKSNIGFFIAHKDLFSTWISMGNDFDVSNVRDALSAFNRSIFPKHKKLFEKIFNTLETGLSKLGDSSGAQTKAISQLIHLIKDIPMDGQQDYDVLGFIYEYLIGMFAANAGKKAGEFYTPHEVSVLMSEIVANHLKDRTEIKIYDPTSGSGSLLINIGRSVARHFANDNSIMYYAQELKENTYNLTRMNLVMRGILADNIFTRNADTLEDDWPFFEENDPVNTYNPLYVDAVVSNPPYSQKWDSANKETDPRYARFGLAPKTKADYAFLLHDLYHVKPDGIMTIVLPHGVLFRGGEEGAIRKNLIECNHIDTIIGLPGNIFFGTGIPTIIMVLKQKRTNTDVLIVDASKGFKKVGKNNQLRASDIKRIADTVVGRYPVPNFSKVVSREEIRLNDYNLNIPRYVDSSEKAESWDLYASMFGGIPEKEIDGLAVYWNALPGLREALFLNNGSPYAGLKVTDVKAAIREHKSVQTFSGKFKTAFAGFDGTLRNDLLKNMLSVTLSKEETILSNEIFNRLKSFSLIDKYGAFQLLDDEWIKIAGDLEIIQTEGFETTRKVDPNLVLKKTVGNTSQEVQDGWTGRVLPFELVQKTYLNTEYQNLKTMENRLAEISAGFDDIMDSLTEEEKESELTNEAGDSFVASAITKEAKQIQASLKKNEEFAEETLEAKILKLAELISEEKDLKARLRTETAKLHKLTKETIEALTDDQVLNLLELKWITPLLVSLHKLPETVIGELAAKVQTLATKYATTYKDVMEQIHETETTLASLIDELTGNEHDLKGLAEFQLLLKGNRND